MSLTRVFDRIGNPKILVLGDLMLDRYTQGTADRTSQEAPVLVLQVEKQEHRPGGASNVCLMLQVLEASVTCVGVTGSDHAGAILRQMLTDGGIDCGGIVEDPIRPTTLKERLVGRSGSGVPSQMLRVDTEDTSPVGGETEDKLAAALERLIPGHDAVLISDYNKGACTPRCVWTAIDCCRQAGIPVLVDPGRGRDFEIYRGASLIKPNRAETELAVAHKIRSPHQALEAGANLCAKYDFEMAIITLDVDGMALAVRNGTGRLFPTKARSVYDITGAGDMVLSMLGLGLAADVNVPQAVMLANAAAGLEVDRTGVTTLTRDEIRAELETHQVNSRRKISDLVSLARLSDEYRRRGRRIVLTNGCFDLLHVGHATYLEEAASHGDVLVVAINSDDSVRRLKGTGRPVIGESERAAMLAALGCVDHVVVFDDDTPHAVLHAIRPDVLVKGGTYTVGEVVGREVVEAYGGCVQITNLVPGVSTTNIVASLQHVPPRKAG